jgi:hypothetical protein
MFWDCVNSWPAVYQQFSKCLPCIAVGQVYHGILILHIFLFMIWTEQSGSGDNDSGFCVGVTWLSNDKYHNYTDWSFKLFYLVPPGQYVNSTSQWAKIIPFTFIPVHSLLPFVRLTFSVRMIAYNNCFNPPTCFSSTIDYLQGDKMHYYIVVNIYHQMG